MEKKRLFDTKQIEYEDGKRGELRYYCLGDRSGLCESYGILIEMRRDGAWESAAVERITTSLGNIKALLELLSRNTVTPCTLQEIILDRINNF